MVVKQWKHHLRGLVLLTISAVCLHLLFGLQPVTAQGQQMRLGEMRVDVYCLRRGYGAWMINNGADWACTASNGSVVQTLSEADLNTVCREFYGKSDAYAARDQNTGKPALNWSCFVYIPPTPTFTPTPAQTRLGDFRVEWYCNERGFGVRIINNMTDWACTSANSDQTIFVLSQEDFNQICRRTYGNPAAYAVRDQNKPEPAYNWSCYIGAPAPTSTPIPTRAMQVTRLGTFQVEWYCTERQLSAKVINNGVDWACTDRSSGQTSFLLTVQDFDQICKRTYNDAGAFALRDMNNPQPAYNWSCYSFR